MKKEPMRKVVHKYHQNLNDGLLTAVNASFLNNSLPEVWAMHKPAILAASLYGVNRGEEGIKKLKNFISSTWQKGQNAYNEWKDDAPWYTRGLHRAQEKLTDASNYTGELKDKAINRTFETIAPAINKGHELMDLAEEKVVDWAKKFPENAKKNIKYLPENASNWYSNLKDNVRGLKDWATGASASQKALHSTEAGMHRLGQAIEKKGRYLDKIKENLSDAYNYWNESPKLKYATLGGLGAYGAYKLYQHFNKNGRLNKKIKSWITTKTGKHIPIYEGGNKNG